MKINYKIVSGILAAALAYDEVIGAVNRRRFAKLKTIALESEAQRDRARDRSDYLAKVLNDNEIVPNEFDDIIANNLLR